MRKVGANKVVVRWMDTGMATGIFYVDIPYKISGDEVSMNGRILCVESDELDKNEMDGKTAVLLLHTSVGGNKKKLAASIKEKSHRTPK